MVNIKVVDLFTKAMIIVQITGPSYLLWAIENYAECCKIADQIAAKETVEEEEEETMDDGQKMDEIIRYIR